MKTFDHNSGRHLEIDDASVYYQILENSDKPALLFLHGGGGTIEDFNPMLSSFTDDYTCIGMDSRGHGASSIGNKKLSYEVIVSDVIAILEHLKIERISIIGFSDGGIVGYRLAASGKIQIDKLITIGGTWSKQDLDATVDLLKEFTVEKWQELMPEAFEVYQKYNPDKDAKASLEKIIEMWTDGSTSGYPNSDVEKITCPTLIIRGDEDHLFRRESVAKLADSIKDSKFLNVPFASHVAFIDQKEIVTDVILQFLNQKDHADQKN